MKKIATLAASAALFAAALAPVLGAGNSCSNSTTGPTSNNTCTVNNTSSVTVNNVNDAVIRNDVTAISNTGKNSASNNTLGGSITTGNAALNATVSSVANINETNLTVSSAASSNAGENNITGPFSENNAYINNNRNVDVYNSNTATVNNTVRVKADSGRNTADNNTGPASVNTGSTALGLTVGTHVNDSWTDVSFGASSVNNTVGNSTTGPSSYNYATVNNSANANVNNVNDLLVDNYIKAYSRSGRNSASNNTLGGDITTGNATAGVGVNTEGNYNTTEIALAMGGFGNDAGNGVTGPFSYNDSYILNDHSVVVDNWNNKCKSHNADRLDCKPGDLGVFNREYDKVDSGRNVADNNTGGGEVVAGWAQLVKSILTHLNDTLTTIQL